MPKSKFKTVAVIGKHQGDAPRQTMSTLLSHLVERGLTVRAPQNIVDELDATGVEACLADKLCDNADLLISVGGDGTMLRAASEAISSGTPVLGINRGRLGFLADIGQADMLPRVDEILNGNFIKDARLFVQAKLAGESGNGLVALNDVVLQRSDTGRMVDLETRVDGEFVNTRAGDGLIVATATGSTAYAMSCGGPIIHPSLDALLLIPICPHTLSDRPIVVPAGSTIEVTLSRSPGGLVQVFCDGRILGTMDEDQTLTISASDKRLTLIHPADHDYYRMLRSKLRWGDNSRDSGRGDG